MMFLEDMHKGDSSWSSVWTRYAVPVAQSRADDVEVVPLQAIPPIPIFPLAGRCSSPRVTQPPPQRLFGRTESQCHHFWWTQISPSFVVHAPCLEPSKNCLSPTPSCSSQTPVPSPIPFLIPSSISRDDSLCHFGNWCSWWQWKETLSPHKPAHLLRASSLLFKILVWSMHNIIHGLKITIVVMLLDMKSNS